VWRRKRIKIVTSPQAIADPRHTLTTALIEKCWKDPEFKKQVMADPKGMLEKHTGRALPNDFKIFIHEEDAKTLHFSIPPAPSSVAELSDEELERVAGGTEVVVATIVIFTLVASAVASAIASAGRPGTPSPW
jgi:hypothetical protein